MSNLFNMVINSKKKTMPLKALYNTILESFYTPINTSVNFNTEEAMLLLAFETVSHDLEYLSLEIVYDDSASEISNAVVKFHPKKNEQVFILKIGDNQFITHQLPSTSETTFTTNNAQLLLRELAKIFVIANISDGYKWDILFVLNKVDNIIAKETDSVYSTLEQFVDEYRHNLKSLITWEDKSEEDVDDDSYELLIEPYSGDSDNTEEYEYDDEILTEDNESKTTRVNTIINPLYPLLKKVVSNLYEELPGQVELTPEYVLLKIVDSTGEVTPAKIIVSEDGKCILTDMNNTTIVTNVNVNAEGIGTYIRKEVFEHYKSKISTEPTPQESFEEEVEKLTPKYEEIITSTFEEHPAVQMFIAPHFSPYRFLPLITSQVVGEMINNHPNHSSQLDAKHKTQELIENIALAGWSLDILFGSPINKFHNNPVWVKDFVIPLLVSQYLANKFPSLMSRNSVLTLGLYNDIELGKATTQHARKKLNELDGLRTLPRGVFRTNGNDIIKEVWFRSDNNHPSGRDMLLHFTFTESTVTMLIFNLTDDNKVDSINITYFDGSSGHNLLNLIALITQYTSFAANTTKEELHATTNTTPSN